jgi:hypothetical protein
VVGKSLSVGAAYGAPFRQRWRAGAAVKFVTETLGPQTGRATAFDAGILYRSHWPKATSPLSWTFLLRNYGQEGRMLEEKTPLPREWLTGAEWRARSGAWRTTAEYHAPKSGGSFWSAGQEVWLKGMLAIRAGFMAGRSGDGWTLGLGFRSDPWRLDYAFGPGDKALGDVHRFGLSFRFGGAGEKPYQEGLRLAQSGDDAEAIMKFKEALDFDPKHRGAARALRESVERLSREKSP